MSNIQMVDLRSQYLKIKSEIDDAIHDIVESCSFINGPSVENFANNLGQYLNGTYVIPCANGTDALQIALMVLNLKPGDEVIVPAFTYAATAEVIALLKLTPVFVDIDPATFNISVDAIKDAITPKTKVIIPVHLFGQCAEMEPIMNLAKKHQLYVVEDNAQSIGAEYHFHDGKSAKSGTIGTIGCTSFFPSKNLGCYGDGGAVFTHDISLAERIRMIANHGQKLKYQQEIIGCNSRLDSIQAAILDVKLRYLDEYCTSRRSAAHYYTNAIKEIDPNEVIFCTPTESTFSTHVYHQYTLRIKGGRRNQLKDYLLRNNIPSAVYYPLPLHEQPAFKQIARIYGSLANAKNCTDCVLSLPMHTELNTSNQDYIIEHLKVFFSEHI